MSTVAYRAALVREIIESMKRIDPGQYDTVADAYAEGRLDAYAHVLQLVGDEDL